MFCTQQQTLVRGKLFWLPSVNAVSCEVMIFLDSSQLKVIGSENYIGTITLELSNLCDHISVSITFNHFIHKFLCGFDVLSK